MTEEEFKEILDAEETDTVEFKSWTNARNMKEIISLAVDELIAFANTKGGTVYFGVEDKPIEVTGCDRNYDGQRIIEGIYNRNLLGGLYRENPVKSRNYEAVKSSKKWENVGNSYIIPALLLYRYSYI